MKKILVTRKLLKDNEDKISKIFVAKLNSNDEIYSQKKLVELSKDCDGILSSIVDKIDEKTINNLSDKVKIISNYAVGFGNIDIEAASKRNIVVTNTPDVLTDATAEIAILLKVQKMIKSMRLHIIQLVLCSMDKNYTKNLLI